MLGLIGSMATAHGEVGSTDQFTPRVWYPGAQGERRQASRSRSMRRSITTTTRLDEFDVPRRATRTTRVVQRKRPARAVRYAALPTRTVVDATPARRAVQKRAKATRVAALGGNIGVTTVRRPTASLTGGGIAWRASSACLAGNLRSVLAVVAANYGSLTVNSTCRSPSRNRRVGGARKSWHLTGNAADFRVHGANISRVFAYLRGSVGGLKHYGGGRFHIDNGPRRTF